MVWRGLAHVASEWELRGEGLTCEESNVEIAVSFDEIIEEALNYECCV